MFDRLGETLLILRVLRGMSQAELAGEAGIRSSQVSRYETGQVQPQLRQLERLLDALEVELPEMLFALLHVERLVRVLESADSRTPAEALVRDSVAAHRDGILDLHLRMAEAVERAFREDSKGAGESR